MKSNAKVGSSPIEQTSSNILAAIDFLNGLETQRLTLGTLRQKHLRNGTPARQDSEHTAPRGTAKKGDEPEINQSLPVQHPMYLGIEPLIRALILEGIGAALNHIWPWPWWIGARSPVAYLMWKWSEERRFAHGWAQVAPDEPLSVDGSPVEPVALFDNVGEPIISTLGETLKQWDDGSSVHQVLPPGAAVHGVPDGWAVRTYVG